MRNAYWLAIVLDACGNPSTSPSVGTDSDARSNIETTATDSFASASDASDAVSEPTANVETTTDSASCPPGSLRCSCYGNDTCDAGLTCLSGLCVDADAGDACAAGAEGCSCYGNSTCNAGLSCLSNLCVNATPDAIADAPDATSTTDGASDTSSMQDSSLVADGDATTDAIIDSAGPRCGVSQFGICSCLRVGAFGQPNSSSGQGTGSFMNWLLAHSGAAGSTTTTTLTACSATAADAMTSGSFCQDQTHANTLTADYLSNFDIIVMLNMQSWTLSADEIAALGAWVNGGGGLMTLTGYESLPDYSTTNTVLAQFNLQYTGAGAGYVGTGQPPDILVTTLSTLNNDNSDQTAELATLNASSPIMTQLNVLAWYNGYMVQDTDGTGTPIATCIAQTSTTAPPIACPVGGFFGVTKNVGLGHVFAYGDGWVTAEGTWTITSSTCNCGLYNDETKYDITQSATASFTDQIPRFWLNSMAFLTTTGMCATKVISGPIVW